MKEGQIARRERVKRQNGCVTAAAVSASHSGETVQAGC